MAVLSRCQTAAGDGCGRSFINKSTPGLCAKCSLLSTLVAGSDDLENAKHYPQCKGCGGTWRNFTGNFCDECDKENIVPPTKSESPLADRAAQAVATAKASRAHAMDCRLKKQNKPLRALNTTEGLNNARANSTSPTADKIQVNVEVRTRSSLRREQMSTDPNYGKWGRPWPKETFLSEILDESLGGVNLTWDKENAISLIRSEVEFRFSGNKMFIQGTQNQTVGQVYLAHLTGDQAAFYLPTDARSKSAKGPTMFLELYVDKIAFDKRAATIQGKNITVEPESRKRRLDNLLSDDETESLVVAKRPRHPTTYLSSTFIRSAIPSRSESIRSIEFVRGDASTVPDTGEVEILWPNDISDHNVTRASISNTLFAEGQTKKVYKLSIDSKLYVAKHFFGPILERENTSHLEQELIRLKQGQWFWVQFQSLAKERAVDICQDIQFSEGFLIRVSNEDNDEADSVWLVEPRRTTSILKFSGTLQHPTQANKMGKTITAFAHFVYERSAKALVFADIQGSPVSMKNRDGVVLYDLMSHSVDGDSGVGDHGKTGMQSFIDQHKCDFMCESLGLMPFVADTVQAHEDGDSLHG